jgi:1,4-dihydroxy-2-naphthoate octaprenyltransferase
MSAREAARLGRMENRRLLTVLALVLGLALIAVAVVYWAEPAGSLPSFFPGHAAGSQHHHAKHGIAAFLLGCACLVFAWFSSGPAKSRAAA